MKKWKNNNTRGSVWSRPFESEKPELNRLFEAKLEFKGEGRQLPQKGGGGCILGWEGHCGEWALAACCVSPPPTPHGKVGKGQARLPLRSPFEGRGHTVRDNEFMGRCDLQRA